MFGKIDVKILVIPVTQMSTIIHIRHFANYFCLHTQPHHLVPLSKQTWVSWLPLQALCCINRQVALLYKVLQPVSRPLMSTTIRA